MGRLAFIIVLLHWVVIIGSYVGMTTGSGLCQTVYYGAFLHVSPVLLVFNVMALIGSDYNGVFSGMLIAGLALAAVKYTSLILAIRREGFAGLNMATVGLEALYVGASGYYLFRLNAL